MFVFVIMFEKIVRLKQEAGGLFNGNLSKY
jgi:hypothetical protein